jgi:hypothetical protein
MSFGSFAPAYLDTLVAHAAITIGSSATEIKVDATRNNDRGLVVIYNDSDETIYVGGSTVTTTGTTKGIPLVPMQTLILPISGMAFYGVCASGGKSLIVMEAS